MKNISKKIIAIAVLMLLVLSGTRMVNAADINVACSLTSDSKLVAGETVTVNVNYTTAPEGGIGSIMGTLNFDSDVLEYVSAEPKGDWQATPYTASTKILGIERNNNTSTTGAIATITFKVKAGITTEKTTITYNITDVGIAQDVKLSPSVTLYADKAASQNPGSASVENKTPANTTNNTTKAIKSSKTSSSKLPKAGDIASIAIVAGVVVLGSLAVVGFVKYSKNRDIK